MVLMTELLAPLAEPIASFNLMRKNSEDTAWDHTEEFGFPLHGKDSIVKKMKEVISKYEQALESMKQIHDYILDTHGVLVFDNETFQIH